MSTNSHDNRPVYPVNVRVLPAKGHRVKLKADAKETAYLAEEIEAKSVEEFYAELLFTRWRRDGVKLTGTIRSKLTQQCVVTLKPIKTEICEDFERTFIPEGSKLAKPKINSEGEIILDAEGPEIPDEFLGEALDVWEIITEQFHLMIDPFPRLEGAVFEYENSQIEKETPVNSPFAALKALKK